MKWAAMTTPVATGEFFSAGVGPARTHLEMPLAGCNSLLEAAPEPGEIAFVTLDNRQRSIAVALGFRA